MSSVGIYAAQAARTTRMRARVPPHYYLCASSSAWPTVRSSIRDFNNHSLAHLQRDEQLHVQQPARLLSSSAAVDVVPRGDNRQTPAIPESPPFLPVDFETASRIDGEESQILTIELQPGQGVRAESGAMIFMTDSVEMNTQLLSGAMSRFLTGQSVFLTDYVCKAEKAGTICLGTDFYSKIIRLNLQDYGGSLVCQRGAFLAGNAGIAIDMEFTKTLSAGFFGGQGFILQRLTGEGDVFVKAGGALVVRDLDDGETLRISSGSIVAFEKGMDYDVQMMKGIKNAMFGGEGLFVTALTGPGRVWLQGMPPDRMIAEIARRVPAGMGLGIPLGMGAGGGSESPEEGGEGAGDSAGGVGADAVAGSESVAATDAAVEADRQATVATSGIMGSEAVDADSPEALFGDAAPTSSTQDDAAVDENASFASSSAETSFSDDDSFSTPTQEPTFDDSSFTDEFPDGSDDFSDGELFDDAHMSSAADATSAAGDEGASSIFSTLWDLFTGGNDD